jgi:hypothetical protein
MNRPGDAGDRTEDTVRGRYRQWAEANPRPRGESAVGLPEVSEGTVRMASVAVGVLIGLGLLVLAATSFVASRSWGTIGRDGAVVAYFITGFFLTLAGVGCIWATLNHNFRVLAGSPQHH